MQKALSEVEKPASDEKIARTGECWMSYCMGEGKNGGGGGGGVYTYLFVAYAVGLFVY